MKSGQVVLIADVEVGVVVSNGGDTARVMAYYARNGRWSSPMTYDAGKLTPAPDGHREADLARKNIRSHHGVIPCGGSTTKWVRVWPTGTEPT